VPINETFSVNDASPVVVSTSFVVLLPLFGLSWWFSVVMFVASILKQGAGAKRVWILLATNLAITVILRIWFYPEFRKLRTMGKHRQTFLTWRQAALLVICVVITGFLLTFVAELVRG
jgi:hypothetical protein